jgi:hypothetical protein
MCTGELMNKQSNESPWSRLVRVPDGGYLVTTLINSKLASIIVPIAAAVTLTGAAGPSQAAPLSPGGGAVPSAPSNLTASPVSPNEIAVGWQDKSTGEVGFEVHISIAGPTGPFAPAATTGTNVTTWSDGGLVPDSNRCYKVRAILVTVPKPRYSGFSNNACATTLPLPYSPPNMSSYTWPVERPGSGVEVGWGDGSGNEGGFRIEMSDYGLASWVAVGTVGPNTTSFMADLPLCYRVFAFNAAGDSQSSIPGCTAPAAPTNLAATVISGATIELTWTDNSAVEDEYWVSYGAGGCWDSFDEAPIAFLPANSTSFRTGFSPYSPCTHDYYVVTPFRMGVYQDQAFVEAP